MREIAFDSQIQWNIKIAWAKLDWKYVEVHYIDRVY
jgi:hypothetical protein